jgi:hypothetical protein
MPSPIGHSLGSLAVGWLTGRPAPPWRDLLIQIVVLAAIGMAPDLDLLWGRHSRETHSIGAAVLVGFVASWQRWPVGPASRAGIFVCVAATWFIHPVMDAFSIDNADPVGVMLWWPFSGSFVHSAYAFFDPISRHWNSPDIWRHNFTAALHEIGRLAPLAVVVLLIKRQRGKGAKRQLG